MAKPPKGARAGQTPATDAENEQHGGELPQEQISNAIDTPQPDAGAGPADGAGTGEGTESDPDHPAADLALGDAAGAGEQGAGATDVDNKQQRGGELDLVVVDDRVLVRFTGPWKNYSSGDLTRLQPVEAELVINKALAELEEE